MLYFKARFVILLLAFILWLTALPVVGKKDSLSPGLSLRGRGDYNADEVIIGKPEIGELFAAQYRYYQSQSAGSVSVQNNTNENLHAETGVMVAGYAEKPLIVAVSLPAGKTTQVPLRIDFNLDKLPTKGEPLVLDAEVEVSVYESEYEKLCQKRLSAKFQLHNLHTLPDEPPEAIAVFIDAGDQSVAEFTQSVRNAKTEFSHSGFRTPQLRDNSNTAQKLFELMQQARIICVNQAAKEVSPSSAPLSTSWRGAGGEVSPRGRGEYVVQYPSELLRTKIGSSCDCALLYAALLENSNVPVALMVSDEHILVLFQRQEQIEVSPYLRLPHQGGGNYAEQPSNGEGVKEFVSWKNKFWIPLDIRMLKATFPEAKEAGMQAYEKLKQEGKVKPFILREAWEKYKPVRFVSPQSVKEMQLGITYVQHGEYEKAEQIFNRHLNDDASAAAYNNLGNISIRRGNYKEAESRYLEAIKTDPGDGAIYLNLGIAYTIANEDKEAEAMFDSAYSELGSYAQMCYALGIKLDGLEHKEMQLLLKEAENRALQSRTRPLGVRGVLDSKQLPLYWKRR